MTDCAPTPPPPGPDDDLRARIAGLERRIEVQLEELASRRDALARCERDRRRAEASLADASDALRRARKTNRDLRRDLERSRVS